MYNAPAYMATVGNLDVVGPYDDQSWMVRKGTMLNISGVEGYKLKAGDRVAMLISCGFVSVVSGFKQGGYTNASEDGAYFTWGPEPTETQPGSYTICWCGNLPKYTCELGYDFNTKGGVIDVYGPDYFKNERHCIRGTACLIRMQGIGLEDGDMLIAMETEDCYVEGWYFDYYARNLSDPRDVAEELGVDAYSRPAYETTLPRLLQRFEFEYPNIQPPSRTPTRANSLYTLCRHLRDSRQDSAIEDVPEKCKLHCKTRYGNEILQ